MTERRRASPRDWLRFLAALVNHAKHHRMHGQIEINLYDGGIKQVRFVRSVVDPHDALDELLRVDPHATDDLAPADTRPV